MTNGVKPTTLFWVISIIALLWNLMGVMAYLGSYAITQEMMVDAYGEAGAAAMASKPAWATAAFAISVFAGVLGSIALLLRKSWATHLFILSFVGVIVHNIWNFMSGAFGYVGTADKVLAALVVVICLFLIWFARSNSAKGVLS